MIKLNNGVLMPRLGLGTWQLNDAQDGEAAVASAISNGYRMIDTAPSYQNESAVGRAINDSGIDRSELFIITKLPSEDQGFDSTLIAFNKSLERLNLDYIDLYLIHHPTGDTQKYLDSWRAMEQLYESGRVRTIGVSNFWPAQLEQILSASKVKPAINQIQTSPYRQQKAIRKYCTSNYIAVQSSAPLAEGGELLTDTAILEIAQKYQKSPAQIILRWHMQNGLIPIAKASSPAHQKQNLDLFSFELDLDDMSKISQLDRQKIPKV